MRKLNECLRFSFCATDPDAVEDAMANADRLGDFRVEEYTVTEDSASSTTFCFLALALSLVCALIMS